jgi:hypothetical protein
MRAVQVPAKPHPGAAPQLNCELCGHLIAKGKALALLKDRRVTCLRCLDRHDLYNSLDCIGNRAAVACLLDIWP